MTRRAILLLLAMLASACGSAPVRPPIVQPMQPATYTVVVRVFQGPIEADVKSVGAAVEIAGRSLVTDGAGNVDVTGLAGGRYEACAALAGWTRACVSGTVPGGSIDIALERAIAPTLPLRVDGRFWVTDAGTFRPIFQSGLSLLVRGPPERDAFLDQTRALGFNGVRVFAGDLGWVGQTPLVARTNLPALLEAAAARGLYVYVCAITGGRDPVYDVDAHLSAVAEIVHAHPNALLEVANEIGHPSLVDKTMAEWLALARRVIPPGVTWTLGAPGTDEPEPDGRYVADGGLFNDAHLDRGRDLYNQVRRLREIYAISETTRRPAMSGEPIGIAEVPMPGKQRFWDRASDQPQAGGFDDAGTRFAFAYGVLCRGFELGCVFHSEQGLRAELLGPRTTAAAQAFLEGWRSIPTNERLQFVNAGWAGSPVARANFDTGITRAYSFVAGARGWTVFVGVRGDLGVEWGGGWRPARVVVDRPGLRIVELAR